MWLFTCCLSLSRLLVDHQTVKLSFYLVRLWMPGFTLMMSDKGPHSCVYEYFLELKSCLCATLLSANMPAENISLLLPEVFKNSPQCSTAFSLSLINSHEVSHACLLF